MDRRWMLGALLLIAAGGRVAWSEEKTADRRHTIAVTGQGEVKAVPDVVVASFAVENAKRSAAVAAALKALLAAPRFLFLHVRPGTSATAAL
ncbi:MAG: hypothetical protein E6J79_18550 [Deltaproteobacteria bacterium]|nr:MAG: hypothetical protein E6J79_18550 [Deltaproteobacteria bacterium]